MRKSDIPCFPHFASRLHTEKLNGKWRKLIRPLIYWTCFGDKPQHIVVPSEFVTDFASVPRWPLAFMTCGDTGHYAAVIHDYIVREGWNWADAAYVFKEALMAPPYPEPLWRANVMYAVVLIRGILPYQPMPGVLDPR